MSSAYLSVVDVSCVRNDRILFSNINFTLAPGEVLHIRGENGVGKTTLLRCLAGLSIPYSGEIKWQGQPIFESPIYKQLLFYLGHKNTIKPNLTTYENLALSPTLKSKPSPTSIMTALNTVGIESKKETLAKFLSSGQKQRLAIAKLLLADQKLWILDEPLSAMDAKGQQLVSGLMTKHLSNGGMIILTSHQELMIQNEKAYSYLELTPLNEQIEGYSDAF